MRMADINARFSGAALLAVASCVLLSGCMYPTGLKDYAGRWVLKSHGQNMMVLSTKADRGRIVGSITMPKRARENFQGEFTCVSLPIVTRAVSGKRKGKSLELAIGPKSDRTRALMVFRDRNHVSIAFFRGKVPDWKFERVAKGQKIAVFTHWDVYNRASEDCTQRADSTNPR